MNSTNKKLSEYSPDKLLFELISDKEHIIRRSINGKITNNGKAARAKVTRLSDRKNYYILIIPAREKN